MHGLVPEWCGSCRQPVSRTRSDLEVSPDAMLHTSDCTHWNGDKARWAVDLPPDPSTTPGWDERSRPKTGSGS